MKFRHVVVAALPLALLGCGTPVYHWSNGPNDYTLNATSPSGMYGGFIGLSPSADVLPKAASQLCPKGYEKIAESKGAFEGKYIQWRIRCHT